MTRPSWSTTAGLACFVLRTEADPERAVRVAAALIRERHPELMARPWTPVSEGLPVTPGRYEVTTRGEVLGAEVRKLGVARWWTDSWGGRGWSDRPNHHDIVAWRPAPEPWGGDGS